MFVFLRMLKDALFIMGTDEIQGPTPREMAKSYTDDKAIANSLIQSTNPPWNMEAAHLLLRPLKDNRLTYLSSLLTLQPHVVFPKVHIQLSCTIKLPTTPCPPPNLITS